MLLRVFLQDNKTRMSMELEVEPYKMGYLFASMVTWPILINFNYTAHLGEKE